MGVRQNKHTCSGGLILIIGLGAAIRGSQYPVGTLHRMGPGFFPTMLGLILAVLGLATTLSGQWEQSPVTPARQKPQRRAWFCICASLVAFVVVGRYGGLLPATAATVFVAAMGDGGNTVSTAMLLACSVTAVCIVVFWWALHLQFPLFAWG